MDCSRQILTPAKRSVVVVDNTPSSLPSVFVESGLDTLFILSRVPIVVMNPFIPLDQSAPSEARVWPIVRWWGVLTSPNFVVFLIGSVL